MKLHLKNFALFLAIFLNGNAIFSQSLNQIEASFSPTLSSNKIVENSGYFTARMGLGCDLGLTYKRSISSRIEIGTGLLYSKMGLRAPVYLDPYQSSLKVKYYYNFLEFPIIIGFKCLNKNKNGIILDLNLVNQILFSTETRYKNNDYAGYNGKRTFSDLKDSGLDLYNIALQIGCTYRRDIEHNLLLSISPLFKYSLLEMNNMHNWNIGIKLGLGFHF